MSYLENILSSGQNPSFIPPGSGTRTRGDHIVLDAIYGGGSDLATQLNTVHGPAFASMPSAGQEKMDTPAGPIWEKRVKDLGHYPIHGTQKAQDKWKLDAKLSDEERAGLQQLVKQTLTLEFEDLYKQGDYEEASKVAKKLSESEPKPKYERHDPYKGRTGLIDGGGAQGQPTDPTHPKYGQGIARDKSFWESVGDAIKSPFKDFQIYTPSADSSSGLGARGGVQEGDMSWSQQFKDYQGPSSILPEGSDVTKTPDSAWDAILQAFHLQPRGINPDSEQARRFAAEQKAREDAGRPMKEDTIWGPNALNIQMDKDDVHLMENPLGALTGGGAGLVYGTGAEMWDYVSSDKDANLSDITDTSARWAGGMGDWSGAMEKEITENVLPQSQEEVALDQGMALVSFGILPTFKYLRRLLTAGGRAVMKANETAADKLSILTPASLNEHGDKQKLKEDKALNFLRHRVSLEILQEAGIPIPNPGPDGKITIDVYDPVNDTFNPVEVDTAHGLTEFVGSINAMTPLEPPINFTGPGETASAADILKLVGSGRIQVESLGIKSAQGTFLNDKAAPTELKNAAAEAEKMYNNADPNTKGEPLDFFAKMLSQTMGDISDIREKLVQTDRQIKEILGRTPHWLEVVATLLVEAYAASMGQGGVGTAMLKKYTEGKRQQVLDIQKQQTTLLQLMSQQQRNAVDLYTQGKASERAGYKTAQEMVKEDRLVSKPFIDAHQDLDILMNKVINDAKSYDRIDLSKDHIDFTGQKDAPMTKARKERYKYAAYIKNRATLEAQRINKQQKILAWMEAKRSKDGRPVVSLTPGLLSVSAETAKYINIVDWYDNQLSYSYKGEKAPMDEPSAIPKFYDYLLPVLNKDEEGLIPESEMFKPAHGINGLIEAQNRLENAMDMRMDSPGVQRALAKAKYLIKHYYYKK